MTCPLHKRQIREKYLNFLGRIELHAFDFDGCCQAILNERCCIDREMDARFIQDSMFREYACVIDLDENRLLIYVSFQKTPQEDNLYGCSPDENGYYHAA